MTNEISVLPPKETAMQIYQQQNGLDPYLQKIREEIDAFIPDVTTKKGRDAIASIAHKVSRSKTALDGIGKDLVAELKEIPKKIDAERKRVRDTLDEWRDEVRAPLNEWEAAEAARIDGHRQAITEIDLLSECQGMNSDGIKSRIDHLEEVAIGEHWEEFEAEAARTKDAALQSLRAALSAQLKYEQEQAELARLRAESEERARKDEQERIAREAVERANREAEQRAQAEREAAAKREAEAAQRELQLKLQAEQAARRELEAQQRAEQAVRDAAIAAEQAEKDRIEAARQAAEAERQRQIDEQEEIARQEAAREANKNHKAKINREAMSTMIESGIPENFAKEVVVMIAKGLVPNVKIQY